MQIINFIMNFISSDQFKLSGPIILQSMNIGQQNQPLYKKIDNYVFKFDDLLGQGNFSKVYKGINEVTNQTVAIKVIELNSLKSKKLEQLLFSQIDVLKKLSHPNVLKCFQVFTSNRNCYIITEICNGGDLQTKLRKCHHFTQAQAQPYILDVFKGLRYLSQNNIIHRDIKVANIFLHNGVAKIADFGFAKFTKQNFKDINIGSPIYMSPEGFIDNIYGPKTDIWAFGVFIYEMLHGKTPFSHCVNEIDLRKQIKSPISYSSLRSDLSFQIKDVITKCLQINQQRRATISQLEAAPFFQRLLKVEVVPLGGRKNNNFLTTPSSQITSKAVTPNHSNINRPQVRSGAQSNSNSLEKNIYNVKNFYSNYQNNDGRQNSEQRLINSPNNRVLVSNFNSQQQRSLYPSPFRQQPSSQPSTANLNSNINSNIQVQNREIAQMMGQQKQTLQVQQQPSMQNQTLQNKPRVESTYINRKMPLENVMLPGILNFKQAVNTLHYCRLLYKYIVMTREIDDKDRKFISTLSGLMFKILNEISTKIDKKQISYDNETTKKETKLREVSNQYYRKYSSDVERPFNCEISYDIIILSVKNKIQEYEVIYLQKAGNIVYLYLMHFLLVIFQATELLRKCSAQCRFSDWSQYRYIQEFLGRNKNNMNYQSYLDMKMEILKH